MPLCFLSLQKEGLHHYLIPLGYSGEKLTELESTHLPDIITGADMKDNRLAVVSWERGDVQFYDIVF